MSFTAECQNCGLVSSVEALRDIEDITARVYPGELMPAGECPDCGCLALLMNGERSRVMVDLAGESKDISDAQLLRYPATTERLLVELNNRIWALRWKRDETDG